MALASVKLKCDRDGVEVTYDGRTFPDGWATLNIGGSAIMPTMGHLCPACREVFVGFMSAGGSGFKFEPMK